MINPGRLILKSWYALLNGNISVPVYRTDAPSSEKGNYVILRMESSSSSHNNQSFVTNPVLIVDIVTVFDNKINDSIVFDISSEIDELVFPSPAAIGLPVQAGIQIVTADKLSETILPEDDGSKPKINRLISRYSHRVLQLQDQS